MSEELPPVLDSRQLLRIEAVHRGFLYQHLYAVGCLFLAGNAGVSAVVVERDEDIEIVSGPGRTYVQVKTRSALILPSDIDDVLRRFAELRAEHTQGRRTGDARFVIVVNNPPSPALGVLIQSNGIPCDVSIRWPGQPQIVVPAGLPPAWPGIAEALQWCTTVAEKLPYVSLTPESLVWKLAGRVQFTASGGGANADHTFRVETLPALFEQLLVQLQDFPAPPVHYRPQTDEPRLDGDQHVRIICGFSGAGKTSWASQAALHTSEKCAYFDAGDMPGPAIAASLVRELAARLVEQATGEVQRILLPGATGVESLHALDVFVGHRGLRPLVVLDNAHRVAGESLRGIVNVATHLRFVLLCQPSPAVQELEALLGLMRESLQGWDTDAVAAEVDEAGGRGSAATYQRLRTLTAGLPLYVQSAVKIAVSEYGSDVAQLCADLDAQTHTVETAQEVILTRVLETLPTATRNAVAVLSLADVPLESSELKTLLRKSLGFQEAAIAAVIRTLRRSGVVQVFGNQHLKIHDAVRVLGLRDFATLDPAVATLAQESLKNVLVESLYKGRDTSRFSLYIRTLVTLGDIKTLVSLAGEELFHEMGIGGEIWASLEVAAASTEVDPEQRFWALDGLVFAELKSGAEAKLEQRFKAMEELLATHPLGDDEKLAYMMKRMLFQANLGQADNVMASIAAMADALPDKAGHQRIFRYNAGCALWRLKRYPEAEQIARGVIEEYFDALGINPGQVMGRNAPALWPLVKKTATVQEDVKHLADALELCALTVNRQERDSGLLRIHAMKFYDMVGAIDSLVRVGQDLADEFVGRGDHEGARDVIEKNVLPYVIAHNMIDRVVAVRSQYAVLLAYCGQHDEADAEMVRLAPYAGGFSEQQRREVENQRGLIAQLRRRLARPAPSVQPVRPAGQRKIGRNDPCPCGSGLKFKKCHG